MVRSVAGDLPEQVKNNQSVNMAAGNGGQEISQYSWFTVYVFHTGGKRQSDRRIRFLKKPNSLGLSLSCVSGVKLWY